jgi:hypothetical protein
VHGLRAVLSEAKGTGRGFDGTKALAEIDFSEITLWDPISCVHALPEFGKVLVALSVLVHHILQSKIGEGWASLLRYPDSD